MRVSQLTLAYDETVILDNVTFSVDAHLCILGANGSGKSTLAKALCGLLDYSGSILLKSQELKTLPPLQRAQHIAYIPSKMQSFEQFTTVEEFTLLGRYPYKASFKDYTKDDKQRVQEVLQELNISAIASHKLHELSSGQQQLVLIAQALAQESEILIFDEPTANLDPKNTALFVKELNRLRQKHITILITHDIQLAAYFNDPVLFIEDKTAILHTKEFFKTSSLSSAYQIEFKNENGLIGIVYE